MTKVNFKFPRPYQVFDVMIVRDSPRGEGNTLDISAFLNRLCTFRPRGTYEVVSIQELNSEYQQGVGWKTTYQVLLKHNYLPITDEEIQECRS